MGSEGYLINEFIAARTNHRDDEWGGSYENRIRFPLEIVRRTRERVGPTSSSSSACRCSTWSKAARPLGRGGQLAQALEAAGATIINTGIGWHEARIPTIATKVPRAAFAWVTKQLKGKVGIPLVATNRINTPEVAEAVLAEGNVPTWCRWRAPSWPTPTSWQGRAGRPTRSTPASAATRPAWTTPLAARSPPAWSTRAPATRPCW
jgi:2,4-dienoyl-CoA reductase-like NADH-dependent reductase (Old Yellow Enzyme family)